MAGAHVRPLLPIEDGGVRQFYGIWTYDNSHVLEGDPIYPTAMDKFYPTVILRGLSRMYPALKAYFPSESQYSTSKSPMETFLSCAPLTATKQSTGYYCKTSTNTPLISPITEAFDASTDDPVKTLVAGNGGVTDDGGVASAIPTKGLFVCAGVSGFGVMCSQAAGELSAFQVLKYLNINQDPAIRNEMKVLEMRYDGEFDAMEWIKGVGKDGKVRPGREKSGSSGLRTANQL
jgi:glycine/D-amino acid oxidase-like deaminating enzyme